MDLQELLNEEKEKKFNELRTNFLDKVHASDYNLKSAISDVGKAFNKEIQELFSNNYTDSETEYHYVKKFTDEYLRIDEIEEGRLASALKNAKIKLNADYMEHGYYPKIQKFLSQDDPIIIKKIAHLQAYLKVVSYFSDIDKNHVKEIILETRSRIRGLSQEKINTITDKIRSELKILNGSYQDKRIMTKEQNDTLILNFENLILFGKQPINIVKIEKARFPNYFIRHIFFDLTEFLHENLNTKKLKPVVVDFIRKSFSQINEEKQQTTISSFHSKEHAEKVQEIKDSIIF